MRHQKFATCVCLFSVITCTIAAPIGNSTLKIKCCDVWRFLSDLTIEFTGSSFDCVDNACEDLHLVRRFVSESNVMLGVKDLSLPQPISYVDDTLLIDTTLITTNEMTKTMALAFVGRFITVDGLALDHKINLVYDNQNPQRLTVDRPACEYSKHIYNTMVLASVVLLIFFIAMQMIEKESTKLNDMKAQNETEKSVAANDDTEHERTQSDRAPSGPSHALMRPLPDFRHIRLRVPINS